MWNISNITRDRRISQILHKRQKQSLYHLKITHTLQVCWINWRSNTVNFLSQVVSEELCESSIMVHELSEGPDLWDLAVNQHHNVVHFGQETNAVGHQDTSLHHTNNTPLKTCKSQGYQSILYSCYHAKYALHWCSKLILYKKQTRY